MALKAADDAKLHLSQLAVQYYIAGRWGAISQMLPVLGNLLHHAVEMSLKAALASTLTMQDLKNLGHNLPKIWRTFSAQFPEVNSSQFEATIAALHRFEELRYPDSIVEKGAMIQLALFREHVGVDRPDLSDTPSYLLVLEDIDALQALIFRAANINPRFFTGALTEDAKHYLQAHNRYAQSWFADT